jgi:hypothetical protein
MSRRAVMTEGERTRHERRRRWDRRVQAGVVLIALVAGLVAGLLGTHRSWERSPVSLAPVPSAPTSPTTPLP